MGNAAKKVNAIGGYYPDKVDLKVIRGFAKANKIDIEKDATADQAALALTMHFREGSKEDDLCKCEVCGGESPDSLDRCPFCGLESTSDDAEVVEAPPESTESTALPDDEEDDEEEAKPVAKKTTKAAKADKKAAKAEEAKETALVKKTAAHVQLVATEKDLNSAVHNIETYKSDATRYYWRWCNEILDINQRGLWKLRQGEDGEVRYTNFEAFCYHELGMSGQTAYNMMAVAREYAEEDLEALGKSKAVLLLKAAPEDRKALAEKAKQGASASELRKEVKKSKKARGYEGATERAKRGAKGAKGKIKRDEERGAAQHDKITIAKIEGVKTIKAYARPATLKNLDLDACKRAKGLKDLPFGRLELVNGVVMYISAVIGKDGFISFKIDTRRESVAE